MKKKEEKNDDKEHNKKNGEVEVKEYKAVCIRWFARILMMMMMMMMMMMKMMIVVVVVVVMVTTLVVMAKGRGREGVWVGEEGRDGGREAEDRRVKRVTEEKRGC